MAEQPERRGLFRLIADVPALIAQLISDEIERFKIELTKKLTGIAIGVGLVVAAGAVAFLALVMLLIAAVFGLTAVGLPVWAAALIVAGGLLLVVLVLVLVAIAQFKKGDLGGSVRSVQEDVKTIKGIGKRS